MKRVILPVLLLLAGACRAAQPVQIGVAMNEDGQWGAVLAAEAVNASGGIDGDSLVLRIVPAAASLSSRTAISAAEQFAADPRVLAVVGHSSSAASLAASQVYNARQLLHITPTATTPLLSEAGPYTFRMVPDDRRQAAFLTEQVLGSGEVGRIAVLYENNDYGRILHQEIRRRLARAGVRPVYEAPFRRGDDLFRIRALTEMLARTRADRLIWIGSEEELILLLPIVRSRLPDLLVIGSDAVEDGVVYANPAGTFTGIRFVRFTDPEADRMQVLRKRYRERYGQEFTAQAALSYDAVMLLVEGLRSGIRDRRSLREYVASIGNSLPALQGISGTVSFDRNGDAQRTHLLAVVTPDGVRPVDPSAGAR